MPRCDTAFHYLINLRFDEEGKSLRLGVWAVNPPLGYANDHLQTETDTYFLPEFSIDLESFRIEAAKQEARLNLKRQQEAEAQKRAKEMADEAQRRTLQMADERARMAEERARERIEEEATRKQIQWVNVSSKCDASLAPMCFQVRFSFALKNNSSHTITGISFGWDLYAVGNSPKCPDRPSTKKAFPEDSWYEKLSIAPGETKGFDFKSEVLPDNYSNQNLPSPVCIKITDIKVAN
jgi:hypothetical protein